MDCCCVYICIYKFEYYIHNIYIGPALAGEMGLHGVVAGMLDVQCAWAGPPQWGAAAGAQGETDTEKQNVGCGPIAPPIKHIVRWLWRAAQVHKGSIAKKSTDHGQLVGTKRMQCLTVFLKSSYILAFCSRWTADAHAAAAGAPAPPAAAP